MGLCNYINVLDVVMGVHSVKVSATQLLQNRRGASVSKIMVEDHDQGQGSQLITTLSVKRLRLQKVCKLLNCYLKKNMYIYIID